MVKRQIASTGEFIEVKDDKSSSKTAVVEKKTLLVKVHSPFKLYFEGQADSVSATNNTGPFDILPKHHNFITLLNAGDLVVRTAEEEKHIRIARGVMHVKDDTVTVFLDV